MSNSIMEVFMRDEPTYIFSIVSLICLVAMLMIYQYLIIRIKKKSHLKELQLKEHMTVQTNNREIGESILNDIDGPDNIINDSLGIEEKFLYKLLKQHHAQAIQQSNIQFWFSIAGAIMGVVFIILMMSINTNDEWYEYIFEILPGTIIEVISVLFFNQAKDTRDRATDFLES